MPGKSGGRFEDGGVLECLGFSKRIRFDFSIQDFVQEECLGTRSLREEEHRSEGCS